LVREKDPWGLKEEEVVVVVVVKERDVEREV
jgi:hypothetical protein